MGKYSFIEKTHDYSIKGIFTKYACTKMLKSRAILVSLFFTLITFVILIIKHDLDYYDILKSLLTINISIIPDLLGFCVGGYALIIGFGHKEMLQKMSTPLKNKSQMSYFQIVSSIFAISIIFQFLTLLFTYVISAISDFKLVATDYHVGKWVNISAFTFLFFITIHSIMLIFYIVINVFNFGQAMHFVIRKEVFDQTNKVNK